MTTTNIAIAVALGIAAAATLALGWLAIGYHAKQELARQKAADTRYAEDQITYMDGFKAGDTSGYAQATRIIAADLARILDTPAHETALDAYDQLGRANRKLAKLDAYRQLLTRETDQ